ncbi:MAG TPA: glutathione peroxidase [Burkholderiaceae bacterium]|jgi:glutathione peroxidase|nr:glutathione peroxidase [Burkholderiaceae bacterium]
MITQMRLPGFAALTAAALIAVPAPSGRAESAPTAGAERSIPAECPSLLDHRFPRLQDEQPQHLCQFAGRVLLIVNTASYCGFTKQYQDLEQLYRRYRARGFEVLGFPSNDFGNQEPGSNQEIAQFCFDTYSVRFPMFGKSEVRGAGANPLFARLAQDAEAPRWNFHKYLVGRDGRLIASYRSSVAPLDRRLIEALERALAQ